VYKARYGVPGSRKHKLASIEEVGAGAVEKSMGNPESYWWLKFGN